MNKSYFLYMVIVILFSCIDNKKIKNEKKTLFQFEYQKEEQFSKAATFIVGKKSYNQCDCIKKNDTFEIHIYNNEVCGISSVSLDIKLPLGKKEEIGVINKDRINTENIGLLKLLRIQHYYKDTTQFDITEIELSRDIIIGDDYLNGYIMASKDSVIATGIFSCQIKK